MASFANIESLVRPKVGKIVGVDTNGDEYSSLKALWKKVLTPRKVGHESDWYENANSYWDNEANCPCTDDGVLGGYGAITPTDIQGSKQFLAQLQQNFGVQLNKVADCGAGIGRITKNMLLPLFQHVDLVEQSKRLLAGAPAYIGVPADTDRVTFIEQGLQDFAPAAGTYDVIWIQWVIGHLHDTDFIAFIQRCVAGLTANGVVVIKDNVIHDAGQTFVLDLSDYSVCRHELYLKTLLQLSDADIIAEVVQEGFPSELYPVHMIALRAKA